MSEVDERPRTFDVVYYPQMVPAFPRTLVVLGLLFDRIWFPGLHLPSDILPPEEVKERLATMEAGERDPMKKALWRGLGWFVEPRRILKDILVLTGFYGSAGPTEPEANELARAFEEAFYGPPEPGFFPMIEGGFAVCVADNSVAGPGIFTYPPNALLVAAKHGMPLVSDLPFLPTPEVSTDAPVSARALAVLLAMEAVELVLPPLKAVHPELILEVRDHLKDELVPFRAQMLRLSENLRQALEIGASSSDMAREARFLIETRILPDLQAFQARLEDRGGRWRERMLDFSLAAPELAHYFSSMSPTDALGRAAGKICEVLRRVVSRERDEKKEARGLGLTYLLKLPEAIGRER